MSTDVVVAVEGQAAWKLCICTGWAEPNRGLKGPNNGTLAKLCEEVGPRCPSTPTKFRGGNIPQFFFYIGSSLKAEVPVA